MVGLPLAQRFIVGFAALRQQCSGRKLLLPESLQSRIVSIFNDDDDE